MLGISRQDLEAVDKHLRTVLILILGWLCFYLYKKVDVERDARIKEMRESRDFFKDSYFKIDDILRNYKDKELRDEDTTTTDSTVVYRHQRGS